MVDIDGIPGAGLNDLTQNSIDMSRAVAEYGILIVIAGVMLVLFLVQTFFIGYQILTRDKHIRVIAEFSRKALGFFEDEALRNINLDQTRGLVSSEFERAKSDTIIQVAKIKQCNNLDDREYVTHKIDAFIDQSYSNMVTILRKFVYDKNNLATFMDAAWPAAIKHQMLRDCENHEIDIARLSDSYGLLFTKFKSEFNTKIDIT